MKTSRGSRPWCTTISIFKGATRLPCQRLLLEVSCVRCTILTSGMRSRAHPSFLFHSYSDPLDNNTILRPKEHMVDQHGFTDQLFGLCHLLGYTLMPRLPVHKQQLYKPD